MKIYILFICLILSNNIFSQEVSIPTKFLEDGSLYKSFNENSQPLTEFKENEKCLVTDYLGKDIYKIKYKEWVGYVNSDFLDVNEEMMDLYFANEEKERIKAIEERENRRKKIEEIIREKEWNSEESIERRRQDSIARVKEIEKRAQEQQALARKLALEKERIKQDSIAKVKEAERKIQEQQALARKLALEKERIK
ncbi:hypothetical protein, partial [Flavivirga jejuensis]